MSHSEQPTMDNLSEDTNPFQIDTEDLPASVEDSNVNLTPTPISPHDAVSVAAPELPSQHTYPHPRQQPVVYKTELDRYLHSGDDVEIRITEALKTTGNSNTTYIAYVIRVESFEARRRYSEFESLRNGLAKLYPTLIVPPIPSKHTIGDYAVKQGKVKEDVAMISRRKRMLQTFLNRIARHPILSHERIFHRFLDGDASWSEVLHTPPLSLLPKNILKAPAYNPTDMSNPAYSALPSPSAAQPLRHPDQRFLDSEAFTNKFAGHVSGPMEKITRRTMKRLSELSADHADLGGILNGFSLSESGTLAAAVEKTGQAVDATYMSTTRLAQEFEQTWAEPLHEYSQFASIIKKLLAYRHQKHVQYEMTQDAIDNKKEQLEDLEKSEREARRLESALSRRSLNQTSVLTDERQEGDGSHTDDGAEREQREERERQSYVASESSTPRRSGAGLGLLNAISHSLHGMMDVDPETARRNSITKTRESLSQLEDALQASAQDLKYASSTIQADLDRFQRQKVADLREMCINMARSHRDWCKKNLEAWEDVKKEIARIEEHPNRPPPREEPGPSISASNATVGPSAPQ